MVERFKCLDIDVLDANKWTVCLRKVITCLRTNATKLILRDEYVRLMLFNAMVIQALLYGWKYRLATFKETVEWEPNPPRLIRICY